MGFADLKTRNASKSPDMVMTPCYFRRRLKIISELSSRDVAKPLRQCFRENLIWWLTIRGMRMVQLASLLDVNKSQVSHWVKGLHAPPFEMIDRIAEVLEVPGTLLLWDNSDPRVRDAMFQQMAEGVGRTFQTPEEAYATMRMLGAYGKLARMPLALKEPVKKPKSTPAKKLRRKKKTTGKT